MSTLQRSNCSDGWCLQMEKNNQPTAVTSSPALTFDQFEYTILRPFDQIVVPLQFLTKCPMLFNEQLSLSLVDTLRQFAKCLELFSKCDGSLLVDLRPQHVGFDLVVNHLQPYPWASLFLRADVGRWRGNGPFGSFWWPEIVTLPTIHHSKLDSFALFRYLLGAYLVEGIVRSS